MIHCRSVSAVMSAVLLALITGNAMAQDGKAPADTDNTQRLVSSNWTVTCQTNAKTAELLCEASQIISVENTQQTVVAVHVSPLAQQGKAPSFILRLQLPHGVNVPAGIEVKIDGNAFPSPVVQTSSQTGLFARTDLTAPLLASLKKGATMTVGFSAMNGQKLVVPVTLKGFSAVYQKLQ